jgi:uncharacterized membrane protein YeaQ/YmgE (transglycosylase-associated protein family)
MEFKGKYKMSFDLMILPVVLIHMITGNVKESAIAWGIMVALLFFFAIKVGIMLTIVAGLSGFVIAELIFSFANYLEENIFIRLLVLFIGIKLMLWVPAATVGLLAEYLSLEIALKA